MRVQITFHSEWLSRQLAALADRLQNGGGRFIGDALVRAGRIYMLFTRTRFQRASGGDGTWKDLAPSTKLKALRKLAPGLLRQRTGPTVTGARARAIDAVQGLRIPILYDTGRLYRSLTPGGPGYVERLVTPLVIRVGTSAPYAQFHQDGNPPRLPQRTILDVPDPQTVRQMEAQIQAGVEREVAELVNASL